MLKAYQNPIDLNFSNSSSSLVVCIDYYNGLLQEMGLSAYNCVNKESPVPHSLALLAATPALLNPAINPNYWKHTSHSFPSPPSSKHFFILQCTLIASFKNTDSILFLK